MALDHVAHRQRARSSPAPLHRLDSQLIAVSVLMAVPLQTRSRCARSPVARAGAAARAGRANSSTRRAASEPAPAAARSCRPEPQAGSTCSTRGAARRARLDAAQRGRHQVGAEHVLERPARLQRPAVLRAASVLQARRSCARTSSRTTPQEALARRRRPGRAARASPPPPAGCPATRGCLRSVRAAGGRARHRSSKSRVMLSQHQHEARQLAASSGAGRRIAHRRHLHAQQLAGARAGDELRRRAGAAPRCSRCWMLSSAWATSARSNTA